MKINLRNGQLVATLFAHEESDLKKTRDHCTMLAALSPTDKNVSDAAKQSVPCFLSAVRVSLLSPMKSPPPPRTNYRGSNGQRRFGPRHALGAVPGLWRRIWLVWHALPILFVHESQIK
jgi:hypothetical protein